MKNDVCRPAVIYCRVSSKKQKLEGHGLESQEARCREFAGFRNYRVVAVFKDDITGESAKRPGMHAMLELLRKHRRQPHMVLIDDISRLARDVRAHFKLRDAITAAGGVLESPSRTFGDDADSEVHETVEAAFSAYHRRKNAEQVRNRMRARSMNGYWCWRPPVGYRYEKVAGHGKLLVPHEPYATLMQQALEGFASGRFQTQAEVLRYLQAQPEWQTSSNSKLNFKTVQDILTRPVYAGYIDLPEWGVSFAPAKHAPLISFASYQAIQRRLQQGAYAPARKDIRQDFSLRGFVVCDDCAKPLHSCWSKGRSQRYPYYLCATKGCASYGKSIRRDTIEGEFETLLRALRPSNALFALAREIFTDLWNARVASAATRARNLTAEVKQVERGIGQLVERVIDAESPALVRAYETRIREMEERKALLNEQLAQRKETRDFERTFRTALGFLENPYRLWTSGRLEYRRMVLKLAFSDRIAYLRGEGFRTALTSCPFTLLGQFSAPGVGMVEPGGVEPPTS